MNDFLIVAAVIFFIFFIILLFAFFRSIKKRKYFGAFRNFIIALVMMLLSVLCAVINISIKGYSALTREDETAAAEINPTGIQTFTAMITFPDGYKEQYQLTGDEFYIDAHILKWKYPVNILGIHTMYEFDRVAGRYKIVDDDTTKKRTVNSLTQNRLIDIFNLRLKYPFLSFLLDAEYGSASFVTADKPKKINVLVSTTGLLIREAEESN